MINRPSRTIQRPASLSQVSVPSAKKKRVIQKKTNNHDDTLHAYVDPEQLGSLGSVANYRKYLVKTRKGELSDHPAESYASTLGDLQHLDAYTIHKPKRKRFRRNPVLVTDSQQQIQADLMDVHEMSKLNKHCKFILVAIDCFSKRAACIPIKNKSAASVLKGFREVFSQLGKPTKLQVDHGKEFYNGTIQNYMREQDVSVISSRNPEIKAGMVCKLNLGFVCWSKMDNGFPFCRPNV